MLRMLICACGLALLELAAVPATATTAAAAGQVEFVSGDVTVEGAAPSHALVTGAAVAVGDTLRTGSDGEAHLTMEDGAYLAVRPNTVFRIDAYSSRGEADDQASFSLLRGALRSVTGWIGKLHPGGYRINTPMATIGIRGTDHEPLYIPPGEARGDETPGVYDRVNEGVALLTNEAGTVDIPAGKSAEIPHGTVRAPRLLDRPPAFLERRRTRHEVLTARYGRDIHRHIEERLQRRGLLKPGERGDQYLERHRAARAGAAGGGERGAAREQRRRERAARRQGGGEARRDQRPERGAWREDDRRLERQAPRGGMRRQEAPSRYPAPHAAPAPYPAPAGGGADAVNGRGQTHRRVRQDQ